MELEFEDNDGVRIIRLAGRMDLEGAAEIDLRFASLTATRCAFIIVDLTEVEFLASMGVGTLVRNAKAARLREGNLVLFNPRPSVRQVLASTRIDTVLPTFSDLDEARLAARGSLPV